MRMLLFCLLLSASIVSFSQGNITVAEGTNDLNRYTIFFKGEFHDRRVENEHSFLLLTKHLHTHNNLRHLVFEYGPDFSYLANRYLQNQIDLLPNKRYLNFSKAFWDSLISFNLSRPATDRLTARGFDFNRSVLTGMAFNEMMLNKKDFPEPAIQSAINKIIEWKNVAWTWEGQKEFVKQMDDLRSLCKKHEQALMNYFGEDWTSFSAILKHTVKSKSTVDRDKRGIKYVKDFLNTKREGNVLFNYGISHTFLNGIGLAKMLHEDSEYQGKVCSIYPYYQLPVEEKSKIQQRKDSYLPVNILAELESYPSYALVSMEQRGLYPKEFKISQWVYVIPKAKQE